MDEFVINLLMSDDDSDSDVDDDKSNNDDDSSDEIVTAVQAVLELSSNMQHIPNRNKRQRISNYLEETVPGYSDTLFKEHFRMSRSSMQELLRVVGSALPVDSKIKNDLKRNLMYSIWILAKQESFLAVGDRFGLAKSSGHGIFTAIVKALASVIHEYIKWPDRDNLNREALWFQRRSRGFPGIVGAIDGCHIQIKAPSGNPIDFYNRHKTHSIILQGTCDHKGKFIDVFIGMAGRMHDARVFKQSELCKKLIDETNPLLVPNLHLLGDSAYPIMRNLMTPFRDNGRLTPQQTNYNVKLSSMRSIIERAFGHLKGKFRRLRYLDISSPKFGNEIIGACCVLHNFLILRKEINFNDECFVDGNASEDEDIVNYASSDEESTNPGTSKRTEIMEMIWND